MATHSLSRLETLQAQELTIQRLAEPFSSASAAHSRGSDASAQSSEVPTPASLAADLAHYKEYFTKLRFSYLEQVTKEKFLRAIVGDPPQIVDHNDNVELEAQLAIAKAELKSQKLDVAELVADLETKGRDLSQRHEKVVAQSEELRELPGQVSALEEQLEHLQSTKEARNNDDTLASMPLPNLVDLLDSRAMELKALDQQLQQAQDDAVRRRQDLERLERELAPLERQKTESVQAAREAMRRKADGQPGTADRLDLQGRWLRGVESVMQDMLGVSA